MERVFICLGSNIGDRLQYLRSALLLVEKMPGTAVKKASAVYETEPVGKKDQAYFLNAVIEIETTLSALAVAEKFKEIEKQLGRTTSQRWGPREIDIDLLFVGERIIQEKDLIVPHPEMYNRKFVLIPMNEIAGDFIDPVRKLSMSDLLTRCSDTSEVKQLPYSIQSLVVEP
ncbi:MAG: 2-amino-4-hydroxy-6-hydroxymethyldihydropteridine diphosphokinase [Ignavibacteriales bacterium]|nr:2-amino-4-hydroxy-6-hydroxymethyldihydropteridine diphosphokinase [Ignavibacteriales bacterium]